ncbi:MAG: hypothetical protein IPH53_12430 [Flavobacteriales bacterium]|nr:hypothetical protein [Flavobacteriales bacterium]
MVLDIEQDGEHAEEHEILEEEQQPGEGERVTSSSRHLVEEHRIDCDHPCPNKCDHEGFQPAHTTQADST